MKRRNVVRRAVLAWLSISVGGCSFGIVRGPPSDHRNMEDFSCTSQWAAPIIDTFLGSLMLAGEMTDDDEGFVDVNAYPAAAVYGISAVYGFWTVSRCRAARRELIRRSGEPTTLDLAVSPGDLPILPYRAAVLKAGFFP